ncbi:hypothetical protein E5D57_006500 [Metarhizium anisopliae]|nr:hypothetical protein E5D57_006500 [Metarhizium anisopliae]
MGDSLGFDDGRLAKRVRLLSSPELHHNRETKASSQQHAQHPPPPLQLQQREHQPCSSSYEKQQGQPSSLHADPQPQHIPPPPPEYVAASAPSTGIAMVGLHAADDWSRNNPWSNEPIFDPSWEWPASATVLAPPSSHLQLGACRNSLETGHMPPTPSPSTTYGTSPAAATALYAPSVSYWLDMKLDAWTLCFETFATFHASRMTQCSEGKLRLSQCHHPVRHLGG